MESKTTNEQENERSSFIIFNVAGTNYGINSKYVQLMEMIENITPVPNAPHYVDGVMYSRGQVIPVINLRLKFGLEKAPYDIKTRVIVVKHVNRTVGLISDSAKEYLNLSLSDIQPAPEMISGLNASWLEGIARLGDRTILIFNVNELMKAEEHVRVN